MKKFNGAINVSKISKEKLRKGKKGVYARIVVWLNDEPDKYGNSMVIQESSTKKERAAAGYKTNYLGGLKETEIEQQDLPAQKQTSDLPF